MANTRVDNRFLIPAVIDPPKACLTMEVPNDPTHIANLLGALAALIRGMSWEDDAAHSARELIKVWRKYYLTIKISDCATGEIVASGAFGFLGAIRFNFPGRRGGGGRGLRLPHGVVLTG